MGYVNNNNQDLRNQKTLGIDQSFSHTGLVVIAKEGSIIEARGIATKPRDKDGDHSLEERIGYILNEITYLIRKYQIRQVSIEGLSYSGPRSASVRQLAGLYYVILHELHNSNIRYQITPPLTLKKESTGSGKASKQDMLDNVPECDVKKLSELSKLKSESKKFEDIVDAYFLARLASTD